MAENGDEFFLTAHATLCDLLRIGRTVRFWNSASFRSARFFCITVNWTSPLAQYDAYRTQLAEIASIKFDHGDIDATTGTVRITEDDLMMPLDADC